MPRTRPVSEGLEHTRARIIDAAQEIFARDGFVGAKMQEIADLVGIQRPSLFYHFKNKEALFVAAHEAVFARIQPVFRESLVGGGDPFVQLDRVTRTVLAVLAAQPSFARMIARTAVDRHPVAVAMVRGYLQPLLDVSVAFLRRTQRRGVFRRDVDPFFLTVNSWGAALMYFTARDLLAPSAASNGRQDRERFTRSLLQMGNRALAAPGRDRIARTAT